MSSPLASSPDSSRVERPVLLYDGDCGFCRRWVGRWRAMTGEAIEFEPSQEAGARYPQIPAEAFGESVWLVEPDGRVTGAAEAVFRSLALAGRKRYLLWAYERVPGFAAVSEWLYSLVSHNRGTLDPLDRWLIPDPADTRRSYRVTRNVFLRGLGVVYLVAFLSLWVQVDGLIGSRGILPAADFVEAVRTPGASVARQFFAVPTLCWVGASDPALHALCLGGAGLSILLIAGLFPVPVLFLLWLFYLSLVNVGQSFLGYQWDALLLEAGFLAIFFAPLRWRLGASGPGPSRVALFLLRWLLFRLIFLSGVVKLASQDVTWRTLTALRYHYQTQPLPTWTSWYAQQAPQWFGALSVGLVLGIELVAPLFFFARRGRRLVAFVVTVMLQVLIAATGNYGFFNLLAVVLCLTLLDDAAMMRFGRWVWRNPLRSRGRRQAPSLPSPGVPGEGEEESRPLKWPWWVTVPLAVVMVPLTLVPAALQVDRADLVPGWLIRGWGSVSQFDSVNGYGLFAVMTTTRHELVVEGSDDGEQWKAYEFRWKPGDVGRAPAFCTPHMPRLDWQMWFAALNPAGNQDVLLGLLARIHEGSPAVLGLLRSDPFGGRAPRYLRVVQYDYRFTTFSERARDGGAWWRRESAEPVWVQ